MIPTSEADRIPWYHQSFRSRAPFLTCSQRSETSDEFGGRRASEEEAVPMDESRTDAQLRTDDKTVPGPGYPVRTYIPGNSYVHTWYLLLVRTGHFPVQTRVIE